MSNPEPLTTVLLRSRLTWGRLTQYDFRLMRQAYGRPTVRPFSSPEPRIDPMLWETVQENMRRRVLMAKNWLFEPYGACPLLVLTWMHQWETLLIVLYENQWEDTLFQGSPVWPDNQVSPSIEGLFFIVTFFQMKYYRSFWTLKAW